MKKINTYSLPLFVLRSQVLELPFLSTNRSHPARKRKKSLIILLRQNWNHLVQKQKKLLITLLRKKIHFTKCAKK